jgi:hypothetical protein
MHTLRTIIGLVFAALLASEGTAAATNCRRPQLGFSARHTGFNRDESVLSAANAGRLRTIWHTTKKGEWAWSPPVVFGSRVYLGGRGYWEFDANTGAPQGGQGSWSVGSAAVATVAGRQQIFANTGSGNAWKLVAFDRRLGAFAGYDATGGSPALSGGNVYMADPVSASDPATQTVKWQTRPAGETTASAAVGYGKVVVASQPIVNDAGSCGTSPSVVVNGRLHYVTFDDPTVVGYRYTLHAFGL